MTIKEGHETRMPMSDRQVPDQPHSFTFGSQRPEPGSVEIGPRRPTQEELASGGRPAPTEAEKAAVMAQRRAKWAEAGEVGAPTDEDDEGAAELAPPPPNKRPRAIECTLVSNGLRILYGPPQENLSLIVAGILGVEDSRHFVKQMIARTAVCVQQVDGKPYKLPTTWVQCSRIANILGETGVDELMLLHDKYWPTIKKEDLPNVRLIF